MSISTKKFLIARIYTSDTTYYISNSQGNISFGDENYLPLIQNIGSAEKIGNFGEGFQVGKCSLSMINGERWYQGNFIFNLTHTWNNQTIEIRQCDPSNDTQWSDCDPYYKGIIKDISIGNGSIEFDIEDKTYLDEKIIPKYTVEKYVADYKPGSISTDDIPTSSKGKFIPINIGDLTDTSNGIFAKGIAISNKIGFQEIVFDEQPMTEINNIGAWDTGLKRYFTGRQRSIISGAVQGEYEFHANKNSVIFSVDSAATLSDSCAAGDEVLTINEYSKLYWSDEDSESNEKLLSTNIISIGGELMLLREKPASNQVYVERGYGGTTATSHGSGLAIYQSAKYSARNLLTFTELFRPSAVSNIYHYPILATYDPITDGKWANITDSDDTNFVELTSQNAALDTCVNFDAKFQTVDSDYTVYNAFVGLKYQFDYRPHEPIWLNPDSTDTYFWIGRNNTVKNSFAPNAVTTLEEYDFCVYIPKCFQSHTAAYTINTISSILRTDYTYIETSVLYYIYPNLLSNSYTNFTITSLKELNDKWKFGFKIFRELNVARLYGVGLWLDFFLDFTKQNILASLKGKLSTSNASIIVAGDESLAGTLMTNPVHILAYLLNTVTTYSSVDNFNLTSWQDTYTYYTNTSAIGSPIPACAFSFGITESKKAWDFCQDIARQFNLLLTKDDDGKINIINLHKLQNTDGTYGYPSATAYKISFEDILNPSGERLIEIKQTGTDRLRNDILLKYHRNNSTGEYDKEIYAIDSYVLPESSRTLAQARTKFFNGSKTESYTIEALAIYNDTDAQRLIDWHTNDKAEVFFWLEITIDHEHYALTQSPAKSSQYFIGDIIYMDGTYNGIIFNSSRKFVVRNVIKKDQGREIELHCKSIEPISEFVSNADLDPQASSVSSSASASSASASSQSKSSESSSSESPSSETGSSSGSSGSQSSANPSSSSASASSASVSSASKSSGSQSSPSNSSLSSPSSLSASSESTPSSASTPSESSSLSQSSISESSESSSVSQSSASASSESSSLSQSSESASSIGDD